MNEGLQTPSVQDDPARPGPLPGASREAKAAVGSSGAGRPLAMIVAMSQEGIIADGPRLPWRIPEDLAFFKAITSGHAVIMGRATMETLPAPLTNRRNLVLSRSLRQPELQGRKAGFEVWPDLDAALAAAYGTDACPFVVGGAQVYRAALPRASRIYITEVRRRVKGDLRLELDLSRFREASRTPALSESDVAFVRWDRASDAL